MAQQKYSLIIKTQVQQWQKRLKKSLSTFTAHGLVAEKHSGTYSLPQLPVLRKTHPFIIIDRKGDVHVLAKTTFEEELYEAQRRSNFGLRRRREKI